MNAGVRANLLTLAVSVVAGVVLWRLHGDHSLLDLLFGTIMCFGGLTVARLVWQAGREARAARADARAVTATDPAVVLAAALAEERVRLAGDIEAVVRGSVTTMLQESEQARELWDADPRPHLSRIAARGQEATHELRRMLGLLRQAGDELSSAPRAEARRQITRLDLAVALMVTLLALIEDASYPPLRPEDATVASMLLTAAAASTILFRRSRPQLGALACGLVFLTGAVAGTPVTMGFWVLATCGGLTWACAARRDVVGACGLLALAGGWLTSEFLWHAVNGPLSVEIVVVAALGGVLAGQARVWRRAARRIAAEHRATLDQARQRALRAERLTVARELHDLVSHAVSVMVMQAGAAEVLHPRDPDAARRSLDLVAATGRDALGELDRLVDTIRDGAIGPAQSSTGAVVRDLDDIEAMVHRIRAAGLDVRLEVEGEVSGEVGSVVFRVVQEALTNTLRHAAARTATVHIHAAAAAVEVAVSDDGAGPTQTQRPGFGLVGITERVQRSGGSLTVTRGPDRGFQLHAWLPTAQVPA